MLQRDIYYIKGFSRWGCYVASQMSLAERHLKRDLFREEVEGIFYTAIRHSFIWHNDKPIEENVSWWRCFVVKPVELQNLILQWVGLDLRVAKMYKGYFPQPDFCIGCYKTSFGYHFVLCDSLGNVVVNPDPDLALLRVDSYRIFELK